MESNQWKFKLKPPKKKLDKINNSNGQLSTDIQDKETREKDVNMDFNRSENDMHICTPMNSLVEENCWRKCAVLECVYVFGRHLSWVQIYERRRAWRNGGSNEK